MHMDRVERELRTSGRLVRNPEVHGYVKALACTIAPEYCDQIRVYVVSEPHFNATMAPNGCIEVWTGLLLRAQNEAQLATVLAHEIAHYRGRHTLEIWRQTEKTTNALVVIQVASAAAGRGYIGDAANFVAFTSLLSFNRDQEREADRVGFELLARAGYDPREAARIWKALIEELELGDEKPRTPTFLSTHPSIPERIGTLDAMAAEHLTDENAGRTGRERYLAAIAPIRAKLLRDELRQNRFERSRLVFTRLLEAGIAPGEMEFYRGELHRLRGKPGDELRAIEHYGSAIEAGDAPAEVHRSYGLVLRAVGEKGDAAEQFQAYVERDPDAPDRAMIESYLAELR